MMAKRWSCVEAGCTWTVVTADSDSAVRAAQEHIATVHGSFELEEMIEEGFVPWASKKGAILQKYTTDQTVGIMAAFMQGMTALQRVQMALTLSTNRCADARQLARRDDTEAAARAGARRR